MERLDSGGTVENIAEIKQYNAMKKTGPGPTNTDWLAVDEKFKDIRFQSLGTYHDDAGGSKRGTKAGSGLAGSAGSAAGTGMGSAASTAAGGTAIAPAIGGRRGAAEPAFVEAPDAMAPAMGGAALGAACARSASRP